MEGGYIKCVVRGIKKFGGLTIANKDKICFQDFKQNESENFLIEKSCQCIIIIHVSYNFVNNNFLLKIILKILTELWLQCAIE